MCLENRGTLHFVMIVFTCLVVTSTVSVAAQPLLEKGDYLEDDFLHILQATRSPLTALEQSGDGPQSINVEQIGRDRRFTANVNWHEGYVIFTLHRDGRLDRGDEQLDYPKPDIDTPRHFRFRGSERGSSWHGYSYVGDVDTVVARIALAGRYVDATGNSVEFGADGIVRGLGPDKPFFLDNDHVLGPRFDYFYIADHREDNRQKTIAFKWVGSELSLYPVGPAAPDSPSGVGEADFHHPLRVLHLVSEKASGHEL